MALSLEDFIVKDMLTDDFEGSKNENNEQIQSQGHDLVPVSSMSQITQINQNIMDNMNWQDFSKYHSISNKEILQYLEGREFESDGRMKIFQVNDRNHSNPFLEFQDSIEKFKFSDSSNIPPSSLIDANANADISNGSHNVDTVDSRNDHQAVTTSPTVPWASILGFASVDDNRDDEFTLDPLSASTSRKTSLDSLFTSPPLSTPLTPTLALSLDLNFNLDLNNNVNNHHLDHSHDFISPTMYTSTSMDQQQPAHHHHFEESTSPFNPSSQISTSIFHQDLNVEKNFRMDNDFDDFPFQGTFYNNVTTLESNQQFTSVQVSGPIESGSSSDVPVIANQNQDQNQDQNKKNSEKEKADKIAIACENCRRRKIKCDKDLKCQHCKRANVTCIREKFVRVRGKGKKTIEREERGRNGN